MDKEEWIQRAFELLLKVMTIDQAQRYAESLYDHFVVDMDDYECSPEDAVIEDMNHWD